MSLAILGGQAKGHSLKVPSGDYIRPMAVPLKRKIFDRYQNFSGDLFWDACAGTGAVGLEAWSRGADEVYFTEKDKKVHPITKENIESLGKKFPDLGKRELKQLNCLHFIEHFKNLVGDKIIFFAPPYPQHQLYKEFLNQVVMTNYKGELWVESDKNKGVSKGFVVDQLGKEAYRDFDRGTTFIQLFTI